MKKKILVLPLLLVSTFALTGCNKSHSVKPAEGEAVESAAGAKMLAASADKVVSYDAFGLSLKDAEIVSKASTYTLEVNADKSTYTAYPLKIEESMSGLNANVAVKGLTAEKNTDVVAAASLKTNLSVSAKNEDPSTPVDFSYSGSGIEAKAYIQDTNFYLDASNQALMNLINAYLNAQVRQNLSSGANFSVTLDPFKGEMAGLFGFLPAPLLSASLQEDIQENAASLEAMIEKLPSYFNFQKYADGTYSVYLSLTHDDIVALVDQYIDEDASYSGPSKDEMNQYLGFVTVNAFEVAAYFDTNIGFTGLDIDIDIKEAATLGDVYALVKPSSTLSLSDEQKKLALSGEEKIYTRFALTYGDAVTVTLPEDLGDYQPFVIPGAKTPTSSFSF
jgi:hypothetical protein